MTIEYGDVPRYQQLALILRQRIESGELAPRTPIPSKRMLRQEYGVAGLTVDKAVRILKDAGMVRTVPGLGLFVQDPSKWVKPESS